MLMVWNAGLHWDSFIILRNFSDWQRFSFTAANHDINFFAVTMRNIYDNALSSNRNHTQNINFRPAPNHPLERRAGMSETERRQEGWWGK